MKKTSIIIFCYNRPRHLKKLINLLKEIKNRKIYIICDGPKNNKNDTIVVKKVRKLINCTNLKISKKNFLEKNVGVRKIFSIGMDWVFKYENKIIVLEDDIIPSHSFFSFCDILLNKYKNIKKISQITGCNVNDKITKNLKETYFLSKYSNIWGWATWKDRWKAYDNNFKNLNNLLNSNFFRKLCPSKNENKFWRKYFNIHYKNKSIGTWDYAWTFANFYKKRLSIVPKYNLIKNIGFDIGSGINPKKLSKLKKKEINFSIKHLKILSTNNEYDKYCSSAIYSIPKLTWRIKKKFQGFFLINKISM